MCGIFFFYSKSRSIHIEDWMIDIAASQLSNRGPDYSSVQVSPENDILLVNSVLSINQGSRYTNYPDLSPNEFFGFNGEIYENSNYNQQYSGSDTEYVLQSFRNSFETNKFYGIDFRGCFAVVHGIRTGHSLRLQIANDFFGERNLFLYENDEFLIISSLPRIISSIIDKLGIIPRLDKSLLSSYIRSRNLLDSPFSFYESIHLLPPGTYSCLEYTSGAKQVIKKHSCWDPASIFSLVKNSPINLDQNNFLSSPHFVLHPSIASSYIVSGGIDSSLVASTTFANPSAHQNYLTLTFGEKDFAANSAQDLISSKTCLEHYVKNVSISEYTEALQESLLLSLSPLSTHSVPSALILGKMAFSLGSRVIYGGDGADEIYLGYPQYLTIFNGQKQPFNCSPYSSFECDEEIQKFQLMHLFDDAQVHQYNRSDLYSKYASLFENECGFSAKEAAIKATLLLDIRYNLHSVALLANDIMISHSSVEPRSPFVSIYHLVNMLKAPIELPLSQTKPVLTKYFEKIFSSPAPVKQGFSGYPNESALELLRSSKPFLGNISDIYQFDFASVFSEMSRRLQWKVLNSELFLLSKTAF